MAVCGRRVLEKLQVAFFPTDTDPRNFGPLKKLNKQTKIIR
jgi:hypothetical protein